MVISLIFTQLGGDVYLTAAAGPRAMTHRPRPARRGWPSPFSLWLRPPWGKFIGSLQTGKSPSLMGKSTNYMGNFQ